MAFQGQEIISLQFGHYSNYIGTHWWNLQEAAFGYNVDETTDINNDILFREGQTRQGLVTFTPRLVLADLKGSLGTLPEDGGLYESTEAPDSSLALWDQEKVKLEVMPQMKKNEFLSELDEQESQMNCVCSNGAENGSLSRQKLYNLKNSVHTWSDYLRTLYHPRTLAIINEYKFKDDVRPFNCFGLGASLWKNPNYQDDMTERIRAYMEEADNLQGFHVLLDGHDGFSGLSSGCLQYINDEYATKAVLAFLCLPADFPSTTVIEDSKRVVNIALTVSSLPDLSSLFSPISPIKEGWRKPKEFRVYPYLNYDPELNYHSSAILAAALETLTLGYRLKNTTMRLADMTSGLRVIGRAATAVSVSLPFPMGPDHSLLKTLEQWNGPFFNSVTPYCDFERVDLQSIVLRGVSKQRLIGKVANDADLTNSAYSCRSIDEMMRLFISHYTYPSPSTHVSSCETTLRTHTPFPSIFNEELISVKGELKQYAKDQSKGVNEAPVLAGLHSTTSISKMLDSLHFEANRINLKELHGLADAGIELLEWQDKLEQILCLSESYSDS
ncbi:misato mitochondrial distribution and morphology regulator [Lycorma delicatula]|uniref:misato mitochondrial distribution and morphology regulator n=1 Tax=Lycorma delicatula TaxID=130591 RepID=UPI003F5137BE